MRQISSQHLRGTHRPREGASGTFAVRRQGVTGLAVSVTLSGLLTAAPAWAHDASIQDGRDASRCKAPGCPDLRSTRIEHTGEKVVFRIATYRAFSTRSALAPTVEVEAGGKRYRLTPKGGSNGQGRKYPVQVSRPSRRSIRYAVSLKHLGSPSALRWRARIDKQGKTADRAPNTGLVAHGPAAAPPARPAPPPRPTPTPPARPLPQSGTSLTASGARTATFTEDGTCSSHRDPGGESPRHDWGGVWTTVVNGRVWILEVTLQRSQFNGPGTYSFKGRTTEDDPASLDSDNWVRFGDGAGTGWETRYTPTSIAGTMSLGPDLRRGTLAATLVNKDDATEVKVSGSFFCGVLATD